MKKVAILGGSGFVGRYIVDELIRSGYFVKMINRKVSHIDSQYLDQVCVDMKSEEVYKELEGCDSLIYNIGIIREFPRNNITFKESHQDLALHAIRMAEKAGVRKFILMSANGVERCLTNYEKTKFKSENYLKSSSLEWTIFRPSLIFGDPLEKIDFCTQMKDEIISRPFPIPLFFSGINFFNAGLFKMSPIHVKDVSQFFVKSIEKKSSNHQIYELGGSKCFSWIQIMQILSEACGRKKNMIPVPVIPVRLLAVLFDRFKWFPITREQIDMLISGNTCNSSNLYSEFEIKELNFSKNNLEYLS